MQNLFKWNTPGLWSNFKPSIKDCERDSRSGIAVRTESYAIVGPSQKRPNDFGVALRNHNFKTSFLKYLVSSKDNQKLQNIVESKMIYVTNDMQCHQIRDEMVNW